MAYQISERCVQCGSCVPVCPVEAISFQGGKVVIDDTKCVSCGGCAAVCPVSAPEPKTKK